MRTDRWFPLCLTLGLLASAAAAQTRYVAFGDSITFGVGDSAEGAPGYPGRLQALLVGAGQQAEVLNRGRGAERTVEGLTRLDSVLAADGGDVLLLMEGSNDVSRGFAVEDTQFNLAQMALKAEARGMAVIHATTIPRIPSAPVDSENVTNQRLNQLIRHMAGVRNRRLVDNFQVFGGQPNLFASYYWLDAEDLVGHPNATGYDLMAQAFFQVITGVDRVPPVDGVVSPANGASGVSSGARIEVEVLDFGAGIDTSGTRLLVNGSEVGAELTAGTRLSQLVYAPTTPLSGVVSVTLRARDLANPANTVEREISRFLVAGTAFLLGDVDADGRVDGADLVTFARRFGSRDGEALYRVGFDLNRDGVIDGLDLAILASNFGRSSS